MEQASAAVGLWSSRVRGFLIVCATVLITIAIGVTTIAVQSPPGFYECPTTKYCVDLARAVGVRGPILAFSESELSNRTGLLVQDRQFYFGDFLSDDKSVVPSQPLWSLRYDLSDRGNLRPMYFLLSDESGLRYVGSIGCPRKLVGHAGGSLFIKSLVTPGGRRFCYGLSTFGDRSGILQVWGRFGPFGFIIRDNSDNFVPFPGGATSATTLRWVEAIVASLTVER